MGPWCYKLPPLNPDVPARATSCSTPVPHDMALLGGSDTICNDPEKSANHICAITLKWLVNLKLFLESLIKLNFT